MFLLFAQRSELFSAVYTGAGLTGFFYLNNFEGKQARLNLCLFDSGLNRINASKQVVEWCFDTFEFKCITYVIPANQHQKRTIADEMGWDCLGVIPGMCWVEKLKRPFDGHLYVIKMEAS